MNSNELALDDPALKTYYMKTSKNSLTQMPVRQFVGSLNLKIPSLKIYSFKNISEQNQRKSKTSLPKFEQISLPRSANIQSVKPLENFNPKAIKNEALTIDSLATTESSYNKPKSGGFPEIKQSKPFGRPLVMKNYKGLQEKINNGLKKNHKNSSKTDLKARSGEKEKVEKCANVEKKYVGIETLKGIMLEGREVYEGFSQSTIRIDPEYDMEGSQREILQFLDLPFFKK